VSEDGNSLELLNPFRWECKRCGEPAVTPSPEAPPFCPSCQKQGTFTRLFPKELRTIWDEGWRAPWFFPPQPSDFELAELYEEVKAFVKDHLVLLNEDQYDVLACWILASWKVEQLPSCPYLLFRGEHESGKTRAIEVLQQLAYRAVPTIGISPAVLFRQIDAFGCTCLIDQAEDELNRKYEDGAMKYAIVASGYKKGMYVARADKQDPTKIHYYPTYAFKALASLRSFDAAIDSRCIIMDMQEANPPREDIDYARAEELRAKLLTWRLMADKLYETPETQLRRRTRELFLPLLWVAKLVGKLEVIEEFGQKYYQKRKKELPDEFRAALIGILRDLVEQVEQAEDEEKRVFISRIKETFQTRGWVDISSQRIGRELKDMDIPREGPIRGKGRYVDVTDERVIEKLGYYVKKFGLEAEEA